jgi:hypothetical protein
MERWGSIEKLLDSCMTPHLHLGARAFLVSFTPSSLGDLTTVNVGKWWGWVLRWNSGTMDRQDSGRIYELQGDSISRHGEKTRSSVYRLPEPFFSGPTNIYESSECFYGSGVSSPLVGCWE